MGQAPTLTLAGLKKLRPCSERYGALADRLPKRGAITAAAAVEAGATLSDLVWVASAMARTNADVERRIRLWLADCAAHVLHIYEQSETSDAPRNAVVAARQIARGEIDAAAWAAAADAAWAAARAAAWAAAADAAWAAAADAARAAAGAAAWTAARAAAGAAAWTAEESWQRDRLVAWLSADEPDDWPLPVAPVRAFAEVAA